jgi:hypothetical protein
MKRKEVSLRVAFNLLNSINFSFQFLQYIRFGNYCDSSFVVVNHETLL